MVAYFAERDEAEGAQEAVLEELPHARCLIEDVVERDWSTEWRSQIKSVTVGRLWVGPPWEKATAPADKVKLFIEPKMAFGTGDHPTTSLCLAAVDDFMAGHPGASVLDVGTGTGVLAFAARKLGAARVVGTDNDPVAVAAREGVRAGERARPASTCPPARCTASRARSTWCSPTSSPTRSSSWRRSSRPRWATAWCWPACWCRRPTTCARPSWPRACARPATWCRASGFGSTSSAPMIRLLVPGAHGTAVQVDGPRLHYLVRVLRLGEGDGLEVFDGQGRAFDAKVAHLGELTAELSLGAPRQAPPSRPLIVLQGLPKADKLELVLQKGTELGAARFVPVAMARSVVKLDGKEDAKQARWQRIAEEAARQCRRADVPVVERPQRLADALAGLAPGTRLLVLDEEEHALPLGTAVAPLLGTQTPIALLVGPEGGVAPEERAQLLAAGATPVTLGRLVLRTETAALAALAVLRHLDGELG